MAQPIFLLLGGFTIAKIVDKIESRKYVKN